MKGSCLVYIVGLQWKRILFELNLIWGHNKYFLHFLIEYTLLMKNQFDDSLGMSSNFFVVYNIQNGHHRALEISESWYISF